jgi:hypothetical protein
MMTVGEMLEKEILEGMKSVLAVQAEHEMEMLKPVPGRQGKKVRSSHRRRFGDTPRQKEWSEAGYRVVASQLGGLGRDAAMSYAEAGERPALASFLRGELGKGLVMATMSACLELVKDKMPHDWTEDLEPLVKELRVSAMTKAGDALASLVTDPLISVLSTWLGGAEDAAVAVKELSEGATVHGAATAKDVVNADVDLTF